MMASEFGMERANDGSSPPPEPIRFSRRPPRELRRLEAQGLQGLEGPALRAALGVRTWTTQYNRVRSRIFGCLAAFFAVVGFMGDPHTSGRLALSMMFAVSCGAISVVWVFAERKPNWVRLDSTGFTRGGPQLLWPSAPPESYRWADYGPFVVDDGEGGSWVESNPSPGSLKFMSQFGDEHDIATILNAYRSVYGPTAQR